MHAIMIDTYSHMTDIYINICYKYRNTYGRHNAFTYNRYIYI